MLDREALLHELVASRLADAEAARRAKAARAFAATARRRQIQRAREALRQLRLAHGLRTVHRQPSTTATTRAALTGRSVPAGCERAS
jgi:hypothetical protein